LQDPHDTPEGKNAYVCKIRAFLEYLGENGLVPLSLFMALPSEAGARTNIIQTLDDTRISELYRFRDQAKSPVELRRAAMVLIGLRMGLRASDIVKMKFADISWDDKAISVQQQKTDRFLRIPMPTEVGNAIYRYIIDGRPNAESEYIFITHRVPYTKLSHCVCWQALNKALPEPSAGFHITRRTYASRLLINNVAAGRIAETLGHADNSSVMQYLSTDGEKMRMCSLPMANVPLRGGILRA
jgi:integrase